MKKFNIIYLGLICFTSLLVSCGDDDIAEDVVIPNEEEVITTVNYTLTPTDGGDAIVISLQDVDGDGGMDPIITGGTFAANTEYTGAIELLNETEDPAEDVTEEIEEEDEDHQLFFIIESADATVGYVDFDENGYPVGLETIFATGEAGSGTITIVLRHLLEKAADGVPGGDITNAGGETELDATIPITIE